MSLITPKKGYKSVPWLFGKEIEIPDEWEVCKIRNLVENKTILEIQDGNHGELHPKSIDFVNQGIPFVTADCIINNNVDYKKCKLLPSKFLKTLRIGFSKKDDVILTHKGSIGFTAIVNDEFETIILSPQTTYYRLSDKLIPKFLYYIFQTHNFQKQLQAFGKQSTRDYVGITAQQHLIIPFIQDVIEQQKIATILSNVDNLIESTVQVITHSKKVKTGLMQKLLTRGIGHTKFKKVPWLFGKEIEIPEEWEIVIIKKLVTFHKQGLYTTQPYSKNGIKIARVNDLENPNLSYDKMNNLELDPKTFDSFKISKGDFLIARTGNIGNYGIVTEDIECVHISDIIRFNFNLNELLNEYFGLFFESHLLLVQLLMIQQSSSHIHINAETMKSLKIPLPPLSEQQKISSILSNIDSKITSQEQYKEKLEKLKKSLMQKLLTGEVRV